MEKNKEPSWMYKPYSQLTKEEIRQFNKYIRFKEKNKNETNWN